MELLKALFTLSPILFSLVAALLIPRLCHVGAIVERALQIYDTQPRALVAVSKPVVGKVGMRECGRFLGFQLVQYALSILFFWPAPLPWRDYAVVQVINRLKFLLPTLFLFLLVWSTCLFLHTYRCSLGKQAMVFRSSNEPKFETLQTQQDSDHTQKSVQRNSDSHKGITKSIYAFIASAVAMWLLPLPARFFSLERIDALDRLDAPTTFTCASVALLWSLLLYLGTCPFIITYGGAASPQASIFKLNLIPLLWWYIFSMVVLFIVSFEAGGQSWPPPSNQEQALPSDDWFSWDGVLETTLVLFPPLLYCVSLFSVTTFFCFLYRYEISQHAPDERRRESLTTDYIRQALVSDDGDTIPKAASATPVSLPIVARRGMPLRFSETSATYRTYAIYLLAHPLAAYLQFRPGWAACGFPLWTKTDTVFPLFNFLSVLVVPFLSIIACILTRHNDVKLWSYRENWKPEQGESQLEAGGVTVASEAGEKEDEALLEKGSAEAQPKISQEHEALLMSANSRHS